MMHSYHICVESQERGFNMVTFKNRAILNTEYERWREMMIPHPVANVQSFISFLEWHRLVDDDLINIWCENREREDEL